MPIQRYQINGGDTLQQIARRELGNADQWWILAQFNGLDHPFIDTTGALYPGKHVLGLGGTLLIVKDVDEPAVKQAAVQDELDQYRLLLGVDMALDDGVLQADPATGDWLLVEGLDNLVGAVKRRLLTRAGHYPYHPEFGSDLEPHIGQALDPAEATSVRLEVIQSLLNDPRIDAVNKVTLVGNAEQIDLTVVCEVIGANEATPLNLVLQR
jgi:phage baseplate assembly protein W